MPGNLATFNIKDGFAEAMLRCVVWRRGLTRKTRARARGVRLGFITEAEFHHISQVRTPTRKALTHGRASGSAKTSRM